MIEERQIEIHHNKVIWIDDINLGTWNAFSRVLEPIIFNRKIAVQWDAEAMGVFLPATEEMKIVYNIAKFAHGETIFYIMKPEF